MGRHVVEMFGCSDLGHVFSFEGKLLLLHLFYEGMKLGGDKEGVDRIGEEDQIRLPHLFRQR